MIIPKIPINISGHQPSSLFRKILQFLNNTGNHVKIKMRFAAIAHCFNAGLSLKIIHHAMPKTME
jgi:hypothetical protein